MKNMTTHIKFIPALLLALAVTFASCENWLDVEPKSQVKDKELFSSQAGFKEALAGVYSTLVDSALYTKDMRFGMIGILAHEWTTFSNATYPEATAYDYSGSNPTKRIATIWEKMYNAIANANVILEEIEGKEALFSRGNRDIIKGEALALRAFIHFDLLRCFGVSYAVDKDKPAIPYMKDYTSKQSKQLTVDQVAQLVIGDLTEALGYLEADPILTGEAITETDDNGYLMNRQLHLNYYAVKGLMARVYLYMGEYELAARYAGDVIGSGKFTWVSQANMIAGIDPSGASEQLWGIDVNNLGRIGESYFESGDSFSIDSETRSYYYGDATTDYRYLYLFRESTSFAGSWFTKKFGGSTQPASVSAYYNNKMAMLKLSEMYLILAESYYHTSGNYLGALNAVAKARNAAEYTSLPEITNTLIAEYRKEFLAEGQLFFLYKRLNQTSIYGAESDVNLVDAKAYTFPLPESELRAADRASNR